MAKQEFWYDGEPKRPPKVLIKRLTLHSALWLTVTSCSIRRYRWIMIHDLAGAASAFVPADVARLHRRCDELDLALARALDRIGALEARLNSEARDTIPAPSHSGADVVPRGSSAPPTPELSASGVQ